MRLVCGHCGHANAADATFCENCDEYLDWTASRVADPEPATPPAAPAAPPAGPPTGAPAARPASTAQPAGTAPVPPVATTAPVPTVATATMPDVGGRCPTCATLNPPERRFCRRCGTWLVVAAAAPAAPHVPWYRSWWRRLVGPRGRAERAAYRRSLSPVTRVFRVLLVLLVVVVVVLLVSPLAGDPIGRLRDQVGHLMDSGRLAGKGADFTIEPLPGSGKGAGAKQPPGVASPAAAAQQAGDDVRSTAWSALWTPDEATSAGASVPLPECGKPLAGFGAIGFAVRFARPTDVREIGIESGGLGDLGKPEEVVSRLPETVHLEWTLAPEDGASTATPPRTVCHPLVLDQSTGLQRFRVTEGEVTALRLTVVSVFRPAVVRGPATVRIGEVSFWRR